MPSTRRRLTPPDIARDLDAPLSDADLLSGRGLPTNEEAERAAQRATDELVAAMNAQNHQVQSDRTTSADADADADARINDQLADLARQTAQLFIRQASALEAGATATADSLGEQLAALTARHTRLMRQKRTAALPITRTTRPHRDVAADLLREIGFAVPVRYLSGLSVSLDGMDTPLTNFGALRRAEQTGYQRNPGRRPSWMAPGINAEVYTANAKWITMSNWDLTERIITEHTGLAGALRCLLHTAGRIERAAKGSPMHERLSALADRISYGLPTLGADPSEGLSGVLERAREHLSLIAPLEAQMREMAADTLSSWPLQVQLWGRTSLISADTAQPYASESTQPTLPTGTEERR